MVAHAGYSFYHTYDIKLRDKFSWAFRSLICWGGKGWPRDDVREGDLATCRYSLCFFHGSMATLEAFCIKKDCMDDFGVYNFDGLLRSLTFMYMHSFLKQLVPLDIMFLL